MTYNICFFANFQIRLKDFKNTYLHRWLNDVSINAFLALLEVTIMYEIYIDDIYIRMIYLYCNLDRIGAKKLHSYQQDIPTWSLKIKVISSFFYAEFHKVSG
jgi:Ulp1 family protease